MQSSFRSSGRSTGTTWTGQNQDGSHITLPPTPAMSSREGSSEGQWPRASVGCATFANLGKGSENQDSYVASATGNKCFAGVFDGHGLRGKRMSEFAKDMLSRTLMDSSELHCNPKLALEEAYQATQREIEKRKGMEAAESGSTAITAYQHRDRLFVANVGDSRAVLGRCDTGGGVRAVDLSSDHKPSREDERRRIIAAGGKIDQSAIPMRTARGGMQWVRVGPERVMTKDGMGGLAMSRSLGDLRLRPAVSAVPEMQERQLDSRDKVVILGSDGVWDHVSSQEAVDIAIRRDNPNAAAREIAEVAKKRWRQETDGQIADDITAVVVRFDHHGASNNGGRPPSNNSFATASSRGSAGNSRGSLGGSMPPYASGDLSPKFSGGRAPLPAATAGMATKPRPMLPAVGPPGAGARGRFANQRAGAPRRDTTVLAAHPSAVAAAGRPSQRMMR